MSTKLPKFRLNKAGMTLKLALLPKKNRTKREYVSVVFINADEEEYELMMSEAHFMKLWDFAEQAEYPDEED